MADDLVQWLRRRAVHHGDSLAGTLNAAADEIERLRAEVATIQESRTVAEHELAALREKAPSIEFERADWVDHMQSVPPDLIGKRVRLVAED